QTVGHRGTRSPVERFISTRSLWESLGGLRSPTVARRISERCKPRRQAIQQQPGSPREARQTINPANPVSKEEEHHQHREYPMGQYPVDAVTGVLDVHVYVIASERLDHERQERQDKGGGDIQHSPPCWKGRSVFARPAVTGNADDIRNI